jgi:hypothetical protein
MATAKESTFFAAVSAAEAVRQAAKAAAFVTYGFVQANLAAYLTALEAADNAYITSVNSAASTLGAAGYTIPNSGTPNPGNVSPGSVGFDAGVSVNASYGGAYGWATMGAIG